MCKTPIAAGFAPNASVFCSKVTPIVDGCVEGGMADATRGWCCTPDMKCGTDYLACECIAPCGSDCCKKGEECVSLGLLRGKQCKPPCAPGFHHDGDGLLVPPTGGPTLIAPLADAARARLLRSIAAELAAFSQRARRAPILQTRGAAKRYRPSAVRTG
jgi:hypothetical protein